MKKNMVLLMCSILMLAILVGVSGCSKSTQNSEQSIEKKLEDYLTFYYTVSDYNSFSGIHSNYNFEELHAKFKPYLTEQGYNDLLAKRRYPRMLETHRTEKYNSKLNGVTLNMTSEDDKEKMRAYTYEVDIIQSYPDTNENKSVKKSGQIQAYYEDNKWKFVHVPYGCI